MNEKTERLGDVALGTARAPRSSRTSRIPGSPETQQNSPFLQQNRPVME